MHVYLSDYFFLLFIYRHKSFFCCFAWNITAWPQSSVQPFRRRSPCLNSQSYRNVFRTLSVKPTLKSASWLMSRTQTSRTFRTESHHRLRKQTFFLCCIAKAKVFHTVELQYAQNKENVSLQTSERYGGAKSGKLTSIYTIASLLPPTSAP